MSSSTTTFPWTARLSHHLSLQTEILFGHKLKHRTNSKYDPSGFSLKCPGNPSGMDWHYHPYSSANIMAQLNGYINEHVFKWLICLLVIPLALSINLHPPTTKPTRLRPTSKWNSAKTQSAHHWVLAQESRKKHYELFIFGELIKPFEI